LIITIRHVLIDYFEAQYLLPASMQQAISFPRVYNCSIFDPQHILCVLSYLCPLQNNEAGRYQLCRFTCTFSDAVHKECYFYK